MNDNDCQKSARFNNNQEVAPTSAGRMPHSKRQMFRFRVGVVYASADRCVDRDEWRAAVINVMGRLI